MRSAVIFALLALAVCQNPLNDVVTGFTTKLAFTDSQVADGNNCLTGLIMEVYQLAPLYQAYVNQDMETLIPGVASFLENFESSVDAACQPFGEDIVNYAITYGNGEEPKVNAATNFPYIAQQLTVLIQNGQQQDFEAVGETLGYIFQILVGSVELDSLLPTPLTYDQAVAAQQNIESLFTNQDNLTAFFQAFVEAYGVADVVDVAGLVQLVTDSKQIVAAIVELRSELSGDFDSDITAIEKFVTAVLEVVRANKSGLESVVAIDGPLLKELVQNPIRYIAITMYNVFSNYPEIMKSDDQMIQAIVAGDFTTAGTIVGNIAKIEYANIIQN